MKARPEIIMQYKVKAPFVDKLTKKDHRVIGRPYTPASKERAEELEKKGFIEPAPEGGNGEGGKPLDKMNKAELVAYAEEQELEVDTSLNKADLRAAIQEAEDDKGGSD